MNRQQQFYKVISSSFANLSLLELKPIALAFWHENYIPNLQDLSFLELQKAGYLIELFANFNCVSDTRQLELMKLVAQIKQDLPLPIKPTKILTSRSSVDAIAQEWNLSEDLSSLMQYLLPFQTRHYIHHQTIEMDAGLSKSTVS